MQFKSNIINVKQCKGVFILDDKSKKDNTGTETRRERFTRVAEARTNKILEMIRLLGNCSNRTTYQYDEDDIKKIFNAIEKELRETRSKFSTLDGKGEKFTLR